MNPHFIFNCLTSIQQLIISGNKTDANEYLVKFSRLIRKTLEMSARPFISIREEKEYLEEYLFLEQLRLSNRFDYSIVADVSINTDNTFIPNMMIQPVVENCVRHGIKSLQDKKGIINVIFKAGQNSIICTVTDNGVGRNSISSFSKVTFTEHKSYGMDIVRKRLETFSEFNIDESGIEIKDLSNADGSAAGTEVILHLPYKNNV
jgi:LytS/YehU family sensor histidine kinase